MLGLPSAHLSGQWNEPLGISHRRYICQPSDPFSNLAQQGIYHFKSAPFKHYLPIHLILPRTSLHAVQRILAVDMSFHTDMTVIPFKALMLDKEQSPHTSDVLFQDSTHLWLPNIYGTRARNPSDKVHISRNVKVGLIYSDICCNANLICRSPLFCPASYSYF